VDLLRVLQDRELRRLGGNRLIKVDVRFIAATNKDLEDEISSKKFREDLYYRLNVVPIFMPPLRERKEDIPLFLESFLTEFCKVHGKKMKMLSEKARQMLVQYPWPGNIRELRNTMERLVLLSRSEIIDPNDLPSQISETEDYQPEITLRLNQPLEEIEKKVISGILSQVTKNRTLAAKMMRISLRALHYKIKRYGLDAE
jgi:transcriptional regulator with PAS, ATPase and Fis domain